MTTAPAYPHDLWTDEVLVDPYAHYQALRDLGPVVWLEAHEVYALPRFDEARAALSSASTYCSGRGVAFNDTANQFGGRNLIMTDGELHTHLRKVLAKNLTPRAIRHMQSAVDTSADAVVEAVVAKGSFDGVTDLAHALPTSVVPDLVGWPYDGRDQLVEWAGATFDFLGPMNDRATAAIPGVLAMQQFAAQIAADGNLLPGSVGAGVIEAAQRGELEPERVPSLIVGYLAPSLDTTISAIGSAVWLFANHPAQWEALRADPSRIPNAFDEVLRFETPIRAFTRVATQAVTIGDVHVPEGARLAVLYGSANRDERRFDEPDRFDITRKNACDQIGFGHGVHGCAGQGLARMEVHALLAAMTRRIETLELNGAPTKGLNNLINFFASVPVRVTDSWRLNVTG
jgi:cytochrome P450